MMGKTGKTASIGPEQRFKEGHPCPICGGYDDIKRGEGQRCYGFLSSDGKYAHCTREEYAEGIDRNPSTGAFPHKLSGDCRCGIQHSPGNNVTTLPLRSGRNRIVDTYDYTNEKGELLYQAVRYEPKRFSQRRPRDSGGWVWSVNGTRRVLYRLPELLQSDETVYVCEGEKDVDLLLSEGLIATTNAMGAKKWREEYTETLAGRHVVVIGDNDKDGRDHADLVARSLSGRVASVKVLELPDLPEKGDVSDWFERGGTVQELEQLADGTPEWSGSDSWDSYDSFSEEEEYDDSDSWDSCDSFSEEEKQKHDPVFPVDALPPKCAEFVMQAAASMLCPPELVGVPLLTVLSGALGFARVIRIKYGWEESAALYAAVVDEPGSKKSPAAGFANAPLERLQSELRLDYKRERETFDKDMRQHAVDKKLAAKENKAEPEPPVPPKMRRCMVDDITVEALAVRLEENPHGFLSAQDELSGFLRGLDQYKSGGKGNARQSYLKIWSNKPIIVDRKGTGEPIVINKPFVTLQGAIQPGVLHELDNSRDDGFLDRWLFAYPVSVPTGYSHETVDYGVEQAYKDVVFFLWEISPLIGEDGVPRPLTVTMDYQAQELFVAKVDALAEEQKEPGFPRRLRGPWSKLSTQLARIALILAVGRNAEEKRDTSVVTGQDMRSALRLLEYFKETTRKVYGQLFEEDPDDALGKALVTVLTDSGYKYFGSISQLMNQLPSNVCPQSPEALSKAIRRIAKRAPSLKIKSSRSNSKRLITITLEKTVPTVPTVTARDAQDSLPEEPATQTLEKTVTTVPTVTDDSHSHIHNIPSERERAEDVAPVSYSLQPGESATVSELKDRREKRGFTQTLEKTVPIVPTDDEIEGEL